MPVPPTSYTVEDLIRTVRDLTIERPVSRKEAAHFLGIEPESLTRQITKGTFPAKYVHKFGGRHYFFLSELSLHLKSL
jgi:hypothetical protein